MSAVKRYEQMILDYQSTYDVARTAELIELMLMAHEDEILHEAAERIRDNIGREDYPNETQRVREIVSVARSMANLIDPEAKS